MKDNAMAFELSNLLIGFVAAALSVVFVHQVIVFVLNTAGVWPAKPWSMQSVGPLNVPIIVNSIFWGGLWGALYAVVHPLLPGDQAWLKGLCFGLLIALLSNFTLLALTKGQPLFMGYDAKKIAIVVVILSGFGIGTAVLFDWLHVLL